MYSFPLANRVDPPRAASPLLVRELNFFGIPKISRRTDSARFQGSEFLQGDCRQRKASKKKKNVAKTIFIVFKIFAEFFQKLSVRVFLAVRTVTSPKNGLQKLNTKFQHCTMIYSGMPSGWSCKPNQFPFATSEKDFERGIFPSTRRSAPRFPPRFRALFA